MQGTIDRQAQLRTFMQSLSRFIRPIGLSTLLLVALFSGVWYNNGAVISGIGVAALATMIAIYNYSKWCSRVGRDNNLLPPLAFGMPGILSILVSSCCFIGCPYNDEGGLYRGTRWVIGSQVGEESGVMLAIPFVMPIEAVSVNQGVTEMHVSGKTRDGYEASAVVDAKFRLIENKEAIAQIVHHTSNADDVIKIDINILLTKRFQEVIGTCDSSQLREGFALDVAVGKLDKKELQKIGVYPYGELHVHQLKPSFE
jgi:hypothetical protein